MARSSDLIRQWFEEVWNKGREEAIDALCAKNAVGHGQTLDDTDIVGPENFKIFWHAFRAAFTSIQVEIHRTMEEGEMAMAQWTLTTQHSGSFLGIEPTEKQIVAKGMSVQRFVDGKIVEAWDNWDQLAVLSQLGAVSIEKITSGENGPEARVA